jgi:hypothetical protein
MASGARRSTRGTRAAGCRAALLLALLAGGAAAADEPTACPPAGWPRERLATLKAAELAVADATARDRLALALLPCLEHPDPWLRDDVAFAALARWMRGDGLSEATRRTILERLLPGLEAPAAAPAAAREDLGVRAPFAALVLAEVARTDRLEPWLDAAERERLLAAATGYLAGVRDYRGFDAEVGWRHGVAHGADLLTQLALHPALGRPALDRILAAVAVQVAPAGEHFYVYGEGLRLARPVWVVATRGLHSADDWSAWFSRVADPAPLAAWGDAFASQAGLAKRHNTLAFLLATYHQARAASDRPVEARLLPGVEAALAAVP